MFDELFQVGVRYIPDIVEPLINRINFLFLNVKAYGLESCFCGLNCQWQSYIAETYHFSHDVTIGNFLRYRFFKIIVRVSMIHSTLKISEGQA